MTVSSCLTPQNQLPLNHLQILPQDSFDLKLNNLSHYSPCFFRKLLWFRLRYAVTLHLWVCGVLLLRQLLVIDAQFRIIQQVLFLFVVATFLLLFSFGIINYGLNLLGMHPIALKQFRGLGRFAWYFYYSIPVFTVVVIEHFIKEQCNIKIKNVN